MQVALFKALRSINIDDTTATAVVDKLEEHLEHMIRDATKNLEAQNKALESKLDGLRSQLTTFSILLSIIGLGVTVAVAAGPILARLVH